MSHAPKTIIGLIAALAIGPALAQPKAETDPVWKKEYFAAAPCYSERTPDADCEARLAALKRSMEAPDATEGSRHYIFKEVIQTKGRYGGNLRARGELKRALAVLEPAYAEMVQHYDNGKHLHTYVDSLVMQREYGLTLLALGRQQEGDKILADARKVLDGVYGWRDKIKTKPAEDLFHQGLLGGERFETELGAYYAGQLESKRQLSFADTEIRDRALDAYRRAELWLSRKAVIGIQNMMEDMTNVRYADIKLATGKLLQQKGAKKESAQEYLLGTLAACSTSASADEIQRDIGQGRCEKMLLTWSAAAGHGDKPFEQLLGILRSDAKKQPLPQTFKDAMGVQ